MLMMLLLMMVMVRASAAGSIGDDSEDTKAIFFPTGGLTRKIKEWQNSKFIADMQRKLENLPPSSFPVILRAWILKAFLCGSWGSLFTWRYHPKDLFRPLEHDRYGLSACWPPYDLQATPTHFPIEAIWYDNTETRLMQTAAYGGTTVGNKPFCMGNLTIGVGFKPWIWCCKVPKVLWLQLKWKKSKERCGYFYRNPCRQARNKGHWMAALA